MAIAFDAISEDFVISDTSLTFSHTCTGSNLLLLVGVMEINLGVEVCSGVTYNAVSLTKIGSIRVGGRERWISLWYLIAPATGAHNVVISLDAPSAIRGHAASYTGALQSSQPDASDTTSIQNADPFNHSLVSVADNCWHVFMVKNGLGTQAAGTGTTRRGAASDSNIMDSNGPKTPAGSVTLQATYGAINDWGSVICSIAPYTAPPPAPVGGYAAIF